MNPTHEAAMLAYFAASSAELAAEYIYEDACNRKDDAEAELRAATRAAVAAEENMKSVMRKNP